jgi:RNA polymerase sigma-70 factor (ECF subfamily)
MTKATDLELVRRACQGEEGALRQLFERHRAMVTRLAGRLLDDPSSLEDVVQDTFVRVFRSLHSFRGEAKFTTWLYRAATNIALQANRKSRRRLPAVSFDANPGLEASLDVDTGQQAALRCAIQQGLEALCDRHRAIITLRHLEGLSLLEIAEVLECPVGTVKSRLHHATRALRKELDGVLSR